METLAIIAHAECDVSSVEDKHHADAVGVGMAASVGQRLLGDPVEGQFLLICQPAGYAKAAVVRVRILRQAFQCRVETDFLQPERTETVAQTAHLLRCRSCNLAQFGNLVACSLGVFVKSPLYGLRLMV